MNQAGRQSPGIPLPPGTREGSADVCEVSTVDRDKVRALADRCLPDRVVRHLAELFKVMGDPTRAKIVHTLTHGELCVCDLAAVLEMSVSAVSHHLRLMRNLRLVKFRKEGRMVYYSLEDAHVIQVFLQALRHVEE